MRATICTINGAVYFSDIIKTFREWWKLWNFDGVEENDLDKEERLNEQNKEEEKQMGFWGYEENELPQEEVIDDDIKDGMTIW